MALPVATPPSGATRTSKGSLHFAYVRVVLGEGARSAGEQAARDEWIAICYRLAPRVERTAATSALLDLGECSDAEAVAALCALREQLTAHGFCARIGIGPSATTAQLALRMSPRQQPLALVTPDQVPALLRRAPVGALVGLHPQSMVTPQVVERLQQYGLHTLGHLARLDERTLRRQFGTVGGFLASAAEGRDARPLCPTPPPARLRIRQRFAAPAAPEQVLAVVPHLAGQMSAQLRLRDRTARALRLSVRWEHGRIEHIRHTLRRYTDDPALLEHELRRLLVPLLAPQLSHPSSVPAAPDDHAEERAECVDALRVTLSDFAPIAPEQSTFWRTQRQRMLALHEVADTLARRHGRALLLQPRIAVPAAVFSEERYTLAVPGDRMPQTEQTEQMEQMGHEAEAVDPASRSALSRPVRADVADPVDGVDCLGDVRDVRGVRDAWQDVPQRLHWW